MAKEIKVKVFDELCESLRGALGFERGEAIDLRVTELPSAPPKMRPRDIREIRQSLNASQGALCAVPQCEQEDGAELGTGYPSSARRGP